MQVSQWAAHHSEENFADPEEFVPERWLDGEDGMGDVGDEKGNKWKREEKYEGDRRGAMQPFSFGPRNCLGKVSVFFSLFFSLFLSPNTRLTLFFFFPPKNTESRPRRNAPHHGQIIMDL